MTESSSCPSDISAWSLTTDGSVSTAVVSGSGGTAHLDVGDVLTSMTNLSVFRVCVASKESGGDHSGDFTMLSTAFEQIEPPTYSPRRTVRRADQKMTVLGQ